MGVDVVTVRVVMHGGLVLVPSGSRWPVEAGPQVAQSQHNKHHANCEFHRKSYAWRQRDAKENEDGAYEKDGDRVPYPPGGADNCRAPGLLLPANDGTDSDDVVGVGGVAHSQQEPDRQNGEQADQLCLKILQPNIVAYPIAAGSTMRWYMTGRCSGCRSGVACPVLIQLGHF